MTKDVHIGLTQEFMLTQETLDLLDQEANQLLTLLIISFNVWSTNCTDKHRGEHPKDLPNFPFLSDT